MAHRDHDARRDFRDDRNDDYSDEQRSGRDFSGFGDRRGPRPEPDRGHEQEMGDYYSGGGDWLERGRPAGEFWPEGERGGPGAHEPRDWDEWGRGEYGRGNFERDERNYRGHGGGNQRDPGQRSPGYGGPGYGGGEFHGRDEREHGPHGRDNPHPRARPWSEDERNGDYPSPSRWTGDHENERRYGGAQRRNEETQRDYHSAHAPRPGRQAPRPAEEPHQGRWEGRDTFMRDARSGYSAPAGGYTQSRYGMYGMTEGEDAPEAGSHFDPDYHRWREEQMRRFDEDYRSWRRERYAKFSDEFDQWRNSRSYSGRDLDSGSGQSNAGIDHSMGGPGFVVPTNSGPTAPGTTEAASSPGGTDSAENSSADSRLPGARGSSDTKVG
jgi:hypothetical protein